MDSSFVYLLNTHGIFILYALVLGWLWFFEKSYEETQHIILTAIVTTVVVLILKEFFDVPRPYLVQGIEPLAGFSVRTDSLPSLHAALAFALSTTVILHQKRFGVVLFLIAAVIGFGRVAAYVHYPGDVTVGSVIGTVVALLMEKIHIKKSTKK